MKKANLIFVVLLTLFVTPLKADFFGLANGRTANMDNMAGLSVDAGLNLKSNFNTFGARVNYKLSPDLMLFGDLGQSNWFGASAFTFGIGGYYQLRSVQLLENTDLALKGAYHTGTFESDFCSGFAGCPEITLSEITFEVLLSGDQLGSSNMAWYANAGIHSLDSSTEIGLGGGVVGDLGFGEWFAGVDLIDQFFLVGGIRYNIN